MKKQKANNCKCAFCQNDKEIAPHQHLLEKLEKKEVILFVGAGVIASADVATANIKPATAINLIILSSL